MHDHYDYTPPIDWVGWLLLICTAVFIYLAFTERSPAAYLRIPPPLPSYDSGATYDAPVVKPALRYKPKKPKAPNLKHMWIICAKDGGCGKQE